MKIKYLQINIQFFHQRKKKATSSLTCALMEYPVSLHSAPRAEGGTVGLKAMARGKGAAGSDERSQPGDHHQHRRTPLVACSWRLHS